MSSVAAASLHALLFQMPAFFLHFLASSSKVAGTQKAATLSLPFEALKDAALPEIGKLSALIDTAVLPPFMKTRLTVTPPKSSATAQSIAPLR